MPKADMHVTTKILRIASVVIASLLLFGPHTVLAQHPLRNLSGMVTDQHHEPLRGAVVQVENEVTNGLSLTLLGEAADTASSGLMARQTIASGPLGTGIDPV